MSTELNELFVRIGAAKSFKELLDGDNAARAYRRLAKLCHPDVVSDGLKAEATAAFGRLSHLYESLTSPFAKPKTIVIAGYVIVSPLAKGDIADLHVVESIRDDDAVLKIVRSERDNDLLDREIKVLAEIGRVDNKIKDYAPKVLNQFKASGRRAVVLPHYCDYLSLEDIVAMNPGGLDFRHVVWMGNRALSLLGMVHRMGVVHGAVLPPHLMYNGTSHDLKLVDWCYSIEIGRPLKVMVKKFTGFYPHETRHKLAVSASTDIYMLMRSLQAAARDIPTRFRHVFEYCTAAQPSARPQDAWELSDLWNRAAADVFGAPRYVMLRTKN